MDLSGVDIDYLNDKEILDLCNNIVDINSDEICKIGNVDINNSSDEKVQELYDDVLSGNNNYPGVPVTANLNDEQILDNNYNTLDRDNSEILLLSGQNINFDSLTEDEILAIYDDRVSERDLIAGTLYCHFDGAAVYDAGYSAFKRPFTCYDEYYNNSCYNYLMYGGVGPKEYWIPKYASTTGISGTCSGYHKVYLSIYGRGATSYGTYYSTWDACSNICK